MGNRIVSRTCNNCERTTRQRHTVLSTGNNYECTVCAEQEFDNNNYQTLPEIVEPEVKEDSEKGKQIDFSKYFKWQKK